MIPFQLKFCWIYCLTASLLVKIAILKPEQFVHDSPALHSISNVNDNNGTGYKVFRFVMTTPAEVEFLKSLRSKACQLQVNFWNERMEKNHPVDVMVPSHRISSVEKLCKSHGIRYTITVEDVQELIIANRKAGEKRKRFAASLRRDFTGYSRPIYDYSDYQSYEKMRQFMRSLVATYPRFAKIILLGKSREGRPLEMIQACQLRIFTLDIFQHFQIGSSSAEPNNIIWINAGIHAREWASSSTAMYIIDKLVKDYGYGGEISVEFKNLVWYITPVLNPDGYEYTRSGTHPDIRLWRKNKSPKTHCPTVGPCCRGVDLNRNFNFNWGGDGSSRDPCDETYQGEFPFSEPETRAVRDFVLKHKQSIKAFIDLHTYSQLWIHPYGHRRSTYPDDVNDLKSIGTRAVQELRKLYGTRYKVGSGADTLYPASGGMVDWVKSIARVKYTYLVELRPDEWVYDGFILDQREILPTARETWQGIKTVAKAVIQDMAKDKDGQRFHKLA